MNNNQSNIGEALFTKTQQRVLGLLYGQHESSFYLNEIVRLADMGKGTVGRELDKLVSVGLVNAFKQGNQSHYQANHKNPIFNELSAIVKKTFGVVRIIKEALDEIMPQVNYAFVYGSVAKGDEHADSDIDVLLVSENLSYTILMEALSEAEKKLGRSINPTLLNNQELADRVEQKQSFISRIVSNEILWLKGEPEFTKKYLV